MDLIKRFNVDLTNKPDNIKVVLNRLKDLSDADTQILAIYADTQSYKETGKILGASKNSVSNKIHRIRKFLLNE